VAYKIRGKKTDTIPADVAAFEKIECIYEKLPGWQKSTEGITDFNKLPKKAQAYLRFLEKESGATIGMVSTGPDREQTMFVEDFGLVVGM
jgi:adenylosuccinate synthase